VKQLIEQLKGMKHQAKHYEPVLWNCQKFAADLWNSF